MRASLSRGNVKKPLVTAALAYLFTADPVTGELFLNVEPLTRTGEKLSKGIYKAVVNSAHLPHTGETVFVMRVIDPSKIPEDSMVPLEQHTLSSKAALQRCFVLSDNADAARGMWGLLAFAHLQDLGFDSEEVERMVNEAFTSTDFLPSICNRCFIYAYLMADDIQATVQQPLTASQPEFSLRKKIFNWVPDPMLKPLPEDNVGGTFVTSLTTTQFATERKIPAKQLDILNLCTKILEGRPRDVVAASHHIDCEKEAKSLLSMIEKKKSLFGHVIKARTEEEALRSPYAKENEIPITEHEPEDAAVKKTAAPLSIHPGRARPARDMPANPPSSQVLAEGEVVSERLAPEEDGKDDEPVKPLIGAKYKARPKTLGKRIALEDTVQLIKSETPPAMTPEEQVAEAQAKLKQESLNKQEELKKAQEQVISERFKVPANAEQEFIQSLIRLHDVYTDASPLEELPLGSYYLHMTLSTFSLNLMDELLFDQEVTQRIAHDKQALEDAKARQAKGLKAQYETIESAMVDEETLTNSFRGIRERIVSGNIIDGGIPPELTRVEDHLKIKDEQLISRIERFRQMALQFAHLVETVGDGRLHLMKDLVYYTVMLRNIERATRDKLKLDAWATSWINAFFDSLEGEGEAKAEAIREMLVDRVCTVEKADLEDGTKKKERIIREQPKTNCPIPTIQEAEASHKLIDAPWPKSEEQKNAEREAKMVESSRMLKEAEKSADWIDRRIPTSDWLHYHLSFDENETFALTDLYLMGNHPTVNKLFQIDKTLREQAKTTLAAVQSGLQKEAENLLQALAPHDYPRPPQTDGAPESSFASGPANSIVEINPMMLELVDWDMLRGVTQTDSTIGTDAPGSKLGTRSALSSVTRPHAVGKIRSPSTYSSTPTGARNTLAFKTNSYSPFISSTRPAASPTVLKSWKSSTTSPTYSTPYSSSTANSTTWSQLGKGVNRARDTFQATKNGQALPKRNVDEEPMNCLARWLCGCFSSAAGSVGVYQKYRKQTKIQQVWTQTLQNGTWVHKMVDKLDCCKCEKCLDTRAALKLCVTDKYFCTGGCKDCLCKTFECVNPLKYLWNCMTLVMCKKQLVEGHMTHATKSNYQARPRVERGVSSGFVLTPNFSNPGHPQLYPTTQGFMANFKQAWAIQGSRFGHCLGGLLTCGMFYECCCRAESSTPAECLWIVCNSKVLQAAIWGATCYGSCYLSCHCCSDTLNQMIDRLEDGCLGKAVGGNIIGFIKSLLCC